MFVKCILIGILIVIMLYIAGKKTYKKGNINNWSYQRYAKFMGLDEFTDNDFDKKIRTIEHLINNEGEINIKEISRKSNCYYEECIIKIKYLMNKRRISNMYIDNTNKTLTKCSIEDEKLLRKYTPFIYRKHLQINDIASRMPGASIDNIENIREQVYKDLIYLDDKNLLNGIIVDRVDRYLRYYSVEKHEIEKNYVSMNCRNCGGLNEVPRGGKKRCEYCETIIESKDKHLSN